VGSPGGSGAEAASKIVVLNHDTLTRNRRAEAIGQFSGAISALKTKIPETVATQCRTGMTSEDQRGSSSLTTI
jgi:hypothetical protein